MTVHACKRAYSRFGAEMSMQELRALQRAILDGEAKRVRHHPDIWSVYWAKIDRHIPVVFRRDVGMIVTVLPVRVLEKGRRYHEPDVDWIELDSAPEETDFAALSDTPINLFGSCTNTALADKLSEALGR